MKLKGAVASALLLAGAGGMAHAADGVKISGFVDINLEHLSTPKNSVNRISSGGLNASRIVFLRWPCALSIDPFSCATPRLLRLGVIP